MTRFSPSHWLDKAAVVTLDADFHSMLAVLRSQRTFGDPFADQGVRARETAAIIQHVLASFEPDLNADA